MASAALIRNLKTRDLEGFVHVHAAEQGFKEQMKVPEVHLVEFGGQFENLRQVRARLTVVPSALALTFVLIFLSFVSLR